MSSVFNRVVSIHIAPATRLVCTASGRKNVVYTPGRPCTVRPVGVHCPSPASGVVTRGCIAIGGGRCGGTATVGCLVWALPLVPALCGNPPFGLPPTAGAWCVYHQCSTVLTTPV